MPETINNFNIDTMQVLAPVIAAQLTSAVFANAVLRHLKGEKADALTNVDAVKEVNDVWMDLWKHIELVNKNAQKDAK